MILEACVLGDIFPHVEHVLKLLDPAKPETADYNNEVSIVCTCNLFAGEDLVASAREMHAVASGSRASKPFYALAINPDRAHGKELSNAQAEEAARRVLKRLGFSEDHQWFLVKHRKKGRVHYHVVANRVDPVTFKAVHLSHNYRTQEFVARELEVLFQLPTVPGAFTHAPGAPPPARSRQNRNEKQQAKRTTIPIQTVDIDLAWAWANAECGADFLFRLEERGYQLAKGDRRDWVVLDPMGGIHSPTRRLRIRVAELRERTRDLDVVSFPSLGKLRTELSWVDQMGESIHKTLDDDTEISAILNHSQKVQP